MGVFQSTLIAASPKFISTTGLSTLQWSILLSMPTLFFVLFSPAWGRLADRQSAQKTIRYPALGLGFSIVLLAAVWLLGGIFSFVPWLWFIAIAVSRILYGLSASGVMPVCQSLALDTSRGSGWENSGKASTNEDTSLKNLGLVSASLSFGRLFAPIMLILFASQLGWLLAAYSLLGMIIAATIYQYSSNRTVNTASTNREESKNVATGSVSLRVFFMLAFCVTAFIGYLQFLLGPLYLEWLRDADEATFMMSITLTVIATTALLCQLFVIKRLNWKSPWLLMVLSILMVVVVVGLPWVGSVAGVIALMIPMGVALALITPLYSRLSMGLSQVSKGQVSGRLAVAHTAGYPLGSLLAGGSYDFISMWWLPLLIIGMAIFVLSCMVNAIFYRRYQHLLT